MKYQVLAEHSQDNLYPQAPYQFSDYTDVLTIYNKDRIPQDFPLSADRITIGRVDTNDIALNDKAISRNHAVLERDDDGWWITDLGSTNGVLFGKTRISANQAVRWSPDSKAHFGPFQLRWQRHLQDEVDEVDDRTQIHLPKNLTQDKTLVQDSAEFVEVKVRTDRRTIDAGSVITVDLNLLSMGLRTDEFQISVEGIPTHWVDMHNDIITLHPASAENIRFMITIPEEESDARGSHEFQVIVESLSDPDLSACDRASFAIEDTHDFELMVRQLPQKDGAICDVAVLNRGNAADFYSISTSSADDNLQFSARQWQLALTPTTQDHLRVMIEPKHRPLMGASRTVSFVINTVSNSGLEKSYYGDMEVLPRLTPQRIGVLFVALIALSAIIWAAWTFLPAGTTAQATGNLLLQFASHLQQLAVLAPSTWL